MNGLALLTVVLVLIAIVVAETIPTLARGGNAARKRLDAGNTGRVNAGFITAKPFRAAYYLRDGVHTTTAGRGARNALIVDAVLAAK